MSKRIDKYTGMVIQSAVTVAKNRKDIHKNLDRACKLIDFGVGYFWERPVRLVVLPEYFLQGVTTPGKGEAGLDDFMDKAITIPGPEIEVLSEKARESIHFRRWCDRIAVGVS
jgi:predicted amidohydrolase